jgi:putative Mn2+ efflux pump MntP
MPLDPNVPPHKTKAFWYFVALAVSITIGYPLVVRPQTSFWFQAASGGILFIAMLCMGWLAIRRLQRGEPRPGILRIVILAVLGIIMLILDQIFKKYLW